MNTAAAQLRLQDFPTQSSTSDDGGTHLIGSAGSSKFEIITGKAVNFFASSMSQEILDIIDLYVGDPLETFAVVRRAERFLSKNFNTKYAELLPSGLTLTWILFEMAHSEVLYLSITDKG